MKTLAAVAALAFLAAAVLAAEPASQPASQPTSQPTSRPAKPVYFGRSATGKLVGIEPISPVYPKGWKPSDDPPWVIHPFGDATCNGWRIVIRLDDSYVNGPHFPKLAVNGPIREAYCIYDKCAGGYHVETYQKAYPVGTISNPTSVLIDRYTYDDGILTAYTRDVNTPRMAVSQEWRNENDAKLAAMRAARDARATAFEARRAQSRPSK